MKKETKSEAVYLPETERAVRETVNDVADRSLRREALMMAARYVAYASRVQSVSQLARECGYRIQQAIYYYLLRNRQLGRRVGDFDAAVREPIEQLLSKLLVENSDNDEQHGDDYGHRSD